MERADRLKRQKEFLIRAAYWTALGGLAILVLRYAAAVLFPFVLAFAVAWALSFPVDFVTERLPMGRKTTAVLIVVLFYALLALLFYLLGYQILNLLSGCTDQLSRFFQESVSPLFRRASAWGEEFFAGDAGGLAVAAGRTGDMAAEISGKVVDGVSAVAGHIPGICMDLFLTVIATLLIELEFPDICAFLAAQVPERFRQYAQNVRKYVLGTLGKCMLSYCLILGLTFAELVAGLLLLRVEGAFLIAFLIALLDILPVFGTGMVLLPWAVIVSCAGDLPFGVGLVALYLVITVIRNIVEPHLVGKQMGLSPVVTLLSMILGLHFLGIAGMFLLPLATAFLKSLNDNGVICIFREWDTEKSRKSWKNGKL